MNGQGTRARVEARAVGRQEPIPGVSTSKGLFLAAAGLSFLMSVYLYFSGEREQGIFVGLWVPSILSAGALLLGRSERE